MDYIDKKKQERRDRQQKRCIYFNGVVNNKCKKNIEYKCLVVDGKTMLEIPCIAGGDLCEHYTPTPLEDIIKRDEEIHSAVELWNKGLSDCCEAPIDKSHVIKEGRNKGHGRYICSKCKKIIFVV